MPGLEGGGSSFFRSVCFRLSLAMVMEAEAETGKLCGEVVVAGGTARACLATAAVARGGFGEEVELG